MLVACQSVNLTDWEVAEPALRRLMRRYIGPRRLALARPRDLHATLRPLGLWRLRSRRAIALARAWLARRPRTRADVLALPGCGPYAADSWAIFVERKRGVEPTDGKLLWHLRREKERCRRRRRS